MEGTGEVAISYLLLRVIDTCTHNYGLWLRLLPNPPLRMCSSTGWKRNLL